MVQDYAPGGDLFKAIEPNGLRESRARKYLYQITKAVEYMHHNKMVHGDIKPQLLEPLSVSNFPWVHLVSFQTDDGTLRFVPEGCIVLILMLKTGRGDGYPVFHDKGFKTFNTEFACKSGWNEAYRSLSIRYSSVLQQIRSKKPTSTTGSAVYQLE